MLASECTCLRWVCTRIGEIVDFIHLFSAENADSLCWTSANWGVVIPHYFHEVLWRKNVQCQWLSDEVKLWSSTELVGHRQTLVTLRQVGLLSKQFRRPNGFSIRFVYASRLRSHFGRWVLCKLTTQLYSYVGVCRIRCSAIYTAPASVNGMQEELQSY